MLIIFKLLQVISATVCSADVDADPPILIPVEINRTNTKAPELSSLNFTNSQHFSDDIINISTTETLLGATQRLVELDNNTEENPINVEAVNKSPPTEINEEEKKENLKNEENNTKNKGASSISPPKEIEKQDNNTSVIKELNNTIDIKDFISTSTPKEIVKEENIESVIEEEDDGYLTDVLPPTTTEKLVYSTITVQSSTVDNAVEKNLPKEVKVQQASNNKNQKDVPHPVAPLIGLSVNKSDSPMTVINIVIPGGQNASVQIQVPITIDFKSLSTLRYDKEDQKINNKSNNDVKNDHSKMESAMELKNNNEQPKMIFTKKKRFEIVASNKEPVLRTRLSDVELAKLIRKKIEDSKREAGIAFRKANLRRVMWITNSII